MAGPQALPGAVLNVLLVVASGAPGGGTTHVRELAVRLDRRRLRVVVACGTDGTLAGDLQARGIEAHPIDFMRGRFSLSAWRALARLIEGTSADVIHAHGSRAALAAAVAMRHASRGRSRLLYTEHGLSFEAARGPVVAIPAALAEASVGLLGAEAIALSSHAARMLGRLRTFRRVTMVPAPVDVLPPSDRPARRAAARRTLGVPGETPVVGSVLRLVPQKAPERFVALAAEVAAARSDVRFVLVGDGPLRPAVEAAVRRARLAARLRLVGFRADAARLCAGFDVLALLSRWEGLPLAVLEAQAEAVPVVATAVGGVPELLAEGAGVAVANGDIGAAARATLRFLDDPAASTRAGERALARIRARHDADHFVARMQAIYAAAGADVTPHAVSSTSST